jgi:hypothetical protein
VTVAHGGALRHHEVIIEYSVLYPHVVSSDAWATRRSTGTAGSTAPVPSCFWDDVTRADPDAGDDSTPQNVRPVTCTRGHSLEGVRRGCCSHLPA